MLNQLKKNDCTYVHIVNAGKRDLLIRLSRL